MTVEEILPTVPRESSPEWDIGLLDLDAYLRRIGYAGPRTATVESLTALHRAHMSSLTFENIDVALGRGISLDMADLRDKLVHSGRGGYCFEHNLLFAAALERLGFPVTRQLGRVRRGSDKVRYRAHAALVVDAGGERWLADVGFGDEGLIEPVPLASGAVVKTGDFSWCVAREADQWVLRSLHPDGWFDLYSFREERHFKVDFDVSNYYTANHPRSTFVGKLIAMRGTENVRYGLKNQEFVSTYADGRTESEELNGTRIVQVLRDVFNIRLTDEEASLIRQRFAAS